MARDYQMKEMEVTLFYSDSDDEIEILSIFAAEEERLKRERASTSRRGSILGHKVIKRDYLQGQERPQGHQTRLFARPRKAFS